MKIGDKVLIRHGHPWANHVATYIGEIDTIVGRKHEFELDNGIRCAAKDNQVKILKESANNG